MSGTGTLGARGGRRLLNRPAPSLLSKLDAVITPYIAAPADGPQRAGSREHLANADTVWSTTGSGGRRAGLESTELEKRHGGGHALGCDLSEYVSSMSAVFRARKCGSLQGRGSRWRWSNSSFVSRPGQPAIRVATAKGLEAGAESRRAVVRALIAARQRG